MPLSLKNRVDEFFIDFDEVQLTDIYRDMAMISMVLGKISYDIMSTSSNHYLVIVQVDNVDFDVIIGLLKQTKCDQFYVEMMELKRAFYARVGSKWVNSEKVRKPPIYMGQSPKTSG